MRPTRLWVAMMLALSGGAAWAQGTPPAAQEGDAAAPTKELGAVVVTATPEEEKKKVIGNTSGASKEDIERRNASHMSDLIDQVSGTSVNSLYSRPEVSVGVQGIAGHGRVSQQLEGITQNFHAFTKDIGQTGSIFVEPQFLRSIDVTRGVSSTTGTLGSLGGVVDFRYLDLDDILRPGKKVGGMVRGSTGFSKYKNGQKPSGSLFVGGRSERWEAMFGASDSENDAYRIGSNVNNGDMLRDVHARNMSFWINDGAKMLAGDSRNNCRYLSVSGASRGIGDSFANCQLTPEKLQYLKQATKSGALTGTEKQADSQMLRLRHFFNDANDQSLELFATTSHAKYQTDQQPQVWMPANGGDAYWGKNMWHIGTELDNQVINLKYKGAFSNLINPEIQLYHEKQERKWNWLGVPGSSAPGESLHYDIDINSTGLKLSNASHFDTASIGPLRLDIGVELRRAKKEVDSMTEDQWHQNELKKQGKPYTVLVWDPASRNDTTALALALSTEGDGPWQASAGIGWQRVEMDVYNPLLVLGNLAKAGSYPNRTWWINFYRSPEGGSYPTATAVAMATAKAAELDKEFSVDPSLGAAAKRYLYDDRKHRYDLKSANLALQYTRPGTGLTTYGSVGYGERAPTSNEMYIYGVWHRQGLGSNPDLEPEKNLSLQLGVKYQQAGWLSPKDTLDAGLGFYYNRIRNYIGYGPLMRPHEVINSGRYQPSNGYVGNVNNLEPVIRSGFELNLAYRQPLFYVRGNLTLPLRHDNKMCSWQSPSGESYYTSTAANNQIYTAMGKGERLCYSGWNWMETGLIEPVRGSLTAALTPMGGKLEVGGTVHYRGKQRASYYYVPEYQTGNNAKNNSSEPLPNEADFLTAYLWPKVIKVDLFANYRFNDQFKVGIYAANLTDRMEATPTTYGYNFYPGRTVTANLEYRF